MKILIADDDPVARLLLRHLLTGRDRVIEEAVDGAATLDRLSGPEPAELAIIDWMMPGMTGPEICRALAQRGRRPATHILLLTSRSESRDVVEGLEAGADDFMAKPYDPAELHARVNVGLRMIRMQRALEDANRHLEERVRERTRQVQELLERNEELLHSVSHDLKTPLVPLLSLLPLLRDGEADLDRRQMLDLAIGGAESIHARVQRVLQLRHLTEGRVAFSLVPVDLRHEAEVAVANRREGADWEGRQATVEVPEGALGRADRLLLQRVLGHLLDNAVKFTGLGGAIRLELRRDGAWMTVVVRDDGAGLERSQLTRVFQPFYKVDASRQRHTEAGLGLTLTQAMVGLWGGRVWAESEGLGKGTAFCFTLPAVGGHELEEAA